jgi:hypothetical protein
MSSVLLLDNNQFLIGKKDEKFKLSINNKIFVGSNINVINNGTSEIPIISKIVDKIISGIDKAMKNISFFVKNCLANLIGFINYFFNQFF